MFPPRNLQIFLLTKNRLWNKIITTIKFEPEVQFLYHLINDKAK